MGWRDSLMSGVFFLIGAAVAVAVLVAMFRPSFAKNLLNTWRTWKEAIYLTVGVILTWYSLTSGVWYLWLIGGAGVIAAVWVLWFDDPLAPLWGWVR